MPLISIDATTPWIVLQEYIPPFSAYFHLAEGHAMNEAQLIHAAALAVISDPARWTQAAPARTDTIGVWSTNKNAVCWCSRGAIEVVSIHCTYKATADVEIALDKAAVTLHEYPHYVKYNDTHTHEEVMTMWQIAGEILATQ